VLAFEVAFGGDGPEDLLIRAEGTPERGEFERFYAELVRDPRFRAGLRILADYGAVDVARLTKDDIASIAESVASREELWGGARLAVVVTNTLGYGFIRMAELMAGLEQVVVRPLYSVDDARDWLRSP
jgi:hypothetical protein